MNEIYERLTEILDDKFDIKIDKDEYHIFEECIFGSKIRMCARDMVYLVVLLEQAYDIEFDHNCFDNEDFYSIKGIAECICDSVKLKQVS